MTWCRWQGPDRGSYPAGAQNEAQRFSNDIFLNYLSIFFIKTIKQYDPFTARLQRQRIKQRPTHKFATGNSFLLLR